MFRRVLVTILVLSLVATSGVGAVGASQTTKIKTPKGTKRYVTLARNPNTQDVLLVYESGGVIFSTLAKSSGSKYKAKKAKAVSANDGANHRPAAAWDEAAAEFLVAWDTGPTSLRRASATARRALDPSDILARRVKRKNGKGTKSVITTVSDGLTNIGPQLFAGDSALSLFYTAHDEIAGQAGRNATAFLRTLSALTEGMSVGNGPEDLGELIEGLFQLVGMVEDDGDFCAWFSAFLDGNATAYNALVDISRGESEIFVAATPTIFDDVFTRAAGFILNVVDDWLEFWAEGDDDDDEDDDDRVGRKALPTVFFEILDSNGEFVVGPRSLGTPAVYRASNPLRRAAQERVGRATGPPVIAAAATDGKARLLTVATDGTVTSLLELFDHKNDIRGMKLIDLEDGRGMVAFTRSRTLGITRSGFMSSTGLTAADM